ncbi:hypothetical protein Ancab_021007 [Ancistrocladus abbreviatus]
MFKIIIQSLFLLVFQSDLGRMKLLLVMVMMQSCWTASGRLNMVFVGEVEQVSACPVEKFSQKGAVLNSVKALQGLCSVWYVCNGDEGHEKIGGDFRILVVAWEQFGLSKAIGFLRTECCPFWALNCCLYLRPNSASFRAYLPGHEITKLIPIPWLDHY